MACAFFIIRERCRDSMLIKREQRNEKAIISKWGDWLFDALKRLGELAVFLVQSILECRVEFW